MKVIDAEEIAKKYPDRKSLNSVLSNTKPVSITEQIESIKGICVITIARFHFSTV